VEIIRVGHTNSLMKDGIVVGQDQTLPPSFHEDFQPTHFITLFMTWTPFSPFCLAMLEFFGMEDSANVLSYSIPTWS
jgi:hypothetical protein